MDVCLFWRLCNLAAEKLRPIVYSEVTSGSDDEESQIQTYIAENKTNVCGVWYSIVKYLINFIAHASISLNIFLFKIKHTVILQFIQDIIYNRIQKQD